MTATTHAEPPVVTLVDARGNKVEYQFYPWDCEHGVSVARRLAPIVQSALEQASDVATAIKDELPKLAALKDAEQSKAMDAMSAFAARFGAPMSALVGAIAQALYQAGDVELILDIMLGAYRRTAGTKDGVKFGGPGYREAFNSAYRANYLELVAALGHALRQNFAPPMERLGNDPRAGDAPRQTPTPGGERRRRHA